MNICPILKPGYYFANPILAGLDNPAGIQKCSCNICYTIILNTGNTITDFNDILLKLPTYTSI